MIALLFVVNVMLTNVGTVRSLILTLPMEGARVHKVVLIVEMGIDCFILVQVNEQKVVLANPFYPFPP